MTVTVIGDMVLSAAAVMAVDEVGHRTVDCGESECKRRVGRAGKRKN